MLCIDFKCERPILVSKDGFHTHRSGRLFSQEARLYVLVYSRNFIFNVELIGRTYTSNIASVLRASGDQKLGSGT